MIVISYAQFKDYIELTPSWSTTVLKMRVSVVCEMTKEQAIIYRRRAGKGSGVEYFLLGGITWFSGERRGDQSSEGIQKIERQ